MKVAEFILRDLLTRLVMVILFFIYPVLAVMALPWAIFDSIGTFGWTTFDDWKRGWTVYSRPALQDLWFELSRPIRLPKKASGDGL